MDDLDYTIALILGPAVIALVMLVVTGIIALVGFIF